MDHRNTRQPHRVRLFAASLLLALPLPTPAQSGIEDPGTLGGAYSNAYGVSADGSVVVGDAYTTGNAARHAFRWTSGGGMIDLGTLGGTHSNAYGVSADGSVVVGWAHTTGNAASHAFRWTSGSGMIDLGTLGGTGSEAYGVSADGSVVVGWAHTTGDATWRAFRWTSGGGMIDLGTLGGTTSAARGVSADGSVVVGFANLTGNAASHAFRWTSGGGMIDLGTLGGTSSEARGVSADGSVVVGGACPTGSTAYRAFRWTQATGMQSVEDWLRAAGVSVPVDITSEATATNGDGSVVVGRLDNSRAFIARVTSSSTGGGSTGGGSTGGGSTGTSTGGGNGLITLDDLQHSLSGIAQSGKMVLSIHDMVLNGAHSRPLSRRVATGQRAFWLAGDWGRDDHGARDGDLGLAEVGLGQNFGPVQINVSLGQTWAQQHQVLYGRAKTDGTYLLAEALIPVRGNLWATLGGYGQRGDADLKRGYLNAGTQDFSTGTPDVNTWALRARLEWDQAYRLASAGFSPYVDLTYSEAKLDAYTETGGGFPARFDARKEKATELRVGVSAVKPLDNGLNLLGTLEAAHRFEKDGARTSGNVIGLLDFDLASQKNKQDWLRIGAGVEGKLAEGRASLSLNVTTKGEMPNAWLAAYWQKAF